MKNFVLAFLALGLAVPAAAIDQGDCCATVGSVCISTCQKSSCTGNGDCELALTSRPQGTRWSTPAIRASLATMDRRDQRALRRLMAEPGNSQVGDKEDEDGAEGGLAVPSDSVTAKPVLIQTGGKTAKVPMKHGSCGLDCGIHVLATQTGNLRIPFKISMSCPSGSSVSFLAYRLKGFDQNKVVDGGPAPSKYLKELSLKPFSANELEAACQEALGGGWAKPGSHNNTQQKVTTNLQEKIEVWGQCTGWANQVKRSYEARVKLTCEDQSWSSPVP